mmetsp:Transcript_28322/g.42875  ORF Transcript_28322/g.42875 Transcript_28322/m.42875 type:complete len:88 (+) Transcript_28322:772-1035(+)
MLYEQRLKQTKVDEEADGESSALLSFFKMTVPEFSLHFDEAASFFKKKYRDLSSESKGSRAPAARDLQRNQSKGSLSRGSSDRGGHR